MRRDTVRALALTLAVALGACDGAGPVPGELTEAEASDLATMVTLATFSSTAELPAPPAAAPGGPATAPYAYTESFEGTVPCPLGGSVFVDAQFEASGDTETSLMHLEYQMTEVHDGCGVQGREGRRFTLWGNPDLTAHFAVDSNPEAAEGAGVVEWGGSIEGTVDWVTDGREGTCTVALEFSGRREGETAVSASAEGTVCEFTVARSFSVG